MSEVPIREELGGMGVGCPWALTSSSLMETNYWHFGLGVTILCIPGYLLVLQLI